MGDVLGFILNAAGLIVPLALESKYSAINVGATTSVQIIAGGGSSSASTGGNVPHIALWDDGGNRIGQYSPGASDKIKDSDVGSYTVENNENGEQQADPYYVMLSTMGNDALCIAAITVSNEKISGTFYGDTGYMCGQSWYPSNNAIGSNFEKPKCVWIDHNHTNKINAVALSFHLNDLAPAADKLAEYQRDRRTICDSTPRFSFWGNMLPNSEIPIFNPPLKYKPDSSDGGQGADLHPKRVIDKPNEYNKGVYMYQGPQNKRMARDAPRVNSQGSGWNHEPWHLIISHDAVHDVREVCEHPNSYGWDIVSTTSNLYCDMEDKTLYHVCDGKQYTDNCFDMHTETIVPPGGRNVPRGAVNAKAYTSWAHWDV